MTKKEFDKITNKLWSEIDRLQNNEYGLLTKITDMRHKESLDDDITSNGTYSNRKKLSTATEALGTIKDILHYPPDPCDAGAEGDCPSCLAGEALKKIGIYGLNK